jgi:hypothetical protein
MIIKDEFPYDMRINWKGLMVCGGLNTYMFSYLMYCLR